MIARLSGTLIESSATSCIIDAGGVGYEVQIPVSTFEKLPQPGNPVVLRIYTQVREDAITLYGFYTPEERALFSQVVGVNGIGGKIALSILSAMPVSTFCAAVSSKDIKVLSRIGGVGPRKAERIALELYDKLDAIGGVGGASAIFNPGTSVDGKMPAVTEVALALEQLGYKRDAITKVMKALLADLPESEHTTEKLLRMAISKLNFG